MDALLTIIIAVLVLGFLVVIHEGGHYLASRAFGVRVSEFMVGLPGPSIGVRRGETRFGVTCIPLGGYARVCGMEPGPLNPHLKEAMRCLYEKGTILMEDIEERCGVSEEEAIEVLDVLVEWGCATPPKRKDEYNTYRAAAVTPTKRQVKRAQKAGLAQQRSYEEGEPRDFDPQDFDAVFESEYRQQYRSLPFWKRAVILVAGPGVNLIFALLAFIVVFSFIGVDLTNSADELVHVTVNPLRAIYVGFVYMGMVVQAVAGLFNPATAAQVVSDSASVVGIAVVSKQAVEAGASQLIEFLAMISVSLGIMNLLPIPPLDGGRFIVELYQKISRRLVSARVLSGITMVGMALFMLLFVVMVNQDIQRLLTGFWS